MEKCTVTGEFYAAPSVLSSGSLHARPVDLACGPRIRGPHDWESPLSWSKGGLGNGQVRSAAMRPQKKKTLGGLAPWGAG